MIIVESAARLAASTLALLKTRMELASVEVEEQSLRYFSYLLLALAALFCCGIAILLGVVLAVVLFWDSYRIGVLATLMILFGSAAAVLAWKLREQYRNKPPLLAHTLQELARDADMLKPRA